MFTPSTDEEEDGDQFESSNNRSGDDWQQAVIFLPEAILNFTQGKEKNIILRT